MQNAGIGSDFIKKISLYIVGTPIGNLGDISERATQTLRNVDFIAAEDTRNSLKLLNRFNIKKPMISYYEHNKREKGEQIIARLLNGETCALITDAGMPAISDPGEDLVALCIEKGILVTAIPGPTAFVTALALSGQKTGRFCFEGFLSTAKKARNEHLQSLKEEKRTIIFYEAPHKLIKTLEDLYKAFGDRKITIARELTKIYEELVFTTLSKAAAHYEEKMPKGEFVLIIEGASETEIEKPTDSEIMKAFQKLTGSGMHKSEAIKQIADAFHLRKNEVYKLCIK
jgi:16S rRNA (cytidine1402-2'-O)-methyltransferase